MANVWTIKANVPVDIEATAGSGTAENALLFGGIISGQPSPTASTYAYTGLSNSWSFAANMNTAREKLGGAGNSSDSLSFGGENGSTTIIATTERYASLGNVWTSKSNIPTAVQWNGGTGDNGGSVFAFGGYNGSNYLYLNYLYSGSGDSWSTISPTSPGALAAGQFAYCGNSSVSFLIGGNADGNPNLNTTYAYSASDTTWTAEGNINTGRHSFAAAGDTSNALCFGGITTSQDLGTTESYSSGTNTWTNESSLNFPRAGLAGGGTSTNAIAMGNDGPLGNGIARTETYGASMSVTQNAFYSNIPIEIAKGGTNTTSFVTTDGTIYFNGTALVTTATGTSGQVLTSGGAGVAPAYASIPANFTWNDTTGGSANLVSANGYVADSGSLTTFTLPANNSLGDLIRIVGKGSGGWKVVYTTNQKIIFGSSTSTTTSGNIASTNANDCVELVCTTASSSAPIFTVVSSIGNITVA